MLVKCFFPCFRNDSVISSLNAPLLPAPENSTPARGELLSRNILNLYYIIKMLFLLWQHEEATRGSSGFSPFFRSQSVFRRFRVERFRLSIWYRAGVGQDRVGSSGCFLWLCNPPLSTTQTTTTMLICLLLNRNCFFDVILWARALFSTPSRERRKVSPFHPPVFRFVV